MLYLNHLNRGNMFAPLGLWTRSVCPEKGTCTRTPCPFTHESVTNAPGSPVALLSTLVRPAFEQEKHKTVPPSAIPPHLAGKRPASPADPMLRPAKVPRLNSGQAAPSSVAAAPQNRRTLPTQAINASGPSSSGPPILRINPGASRIPYDTRQTMVTTLYKIFVELYAIFNSSHQNLAREHALQQEAEIHAKHSKVTYRNVSCVSSCYLGHEINSIRP
jgi:RNA exonuclease 1